MQSNQSACIPLPPSPRHHTHARAPASRQARAARTSARRGRDGPMRRCLLHVLLPGGDLLADRVWEGRLRAHGPMRRHRVRGKRRRAKDLRRSNRPAVKTPSLRACGYPEYSIPRAWHRVQGERGVSYPRGESLSGVSRAGVGSARSGSRLRCAVLARRAIRQSRATHLPARSHHGRWHCLRRRVAAELPPSSG